MNGMVSIVQVAVGIGLLIFIHELGHYLAARAAGVRVDVFSLGFGPRLLGFVRNGTDYRLSMVPLGGYVQVAGQENVGRQFLADDELHAKGFAARTLFFSGGVLMNVLFALVAFPIVFRHGVEFTAPVIGAVDPGGPAWEAGLQPGDRVLAVDGKAMYSFENLQVEVALGGRHGVVLDIERDGESQTVEVDPRYSPDMGLFAIGVQPADEPLRVDEVDPGTPAARAGLRPGDEIVAIDGRALRGFDAIDALSPHSLATDRPLRLEVHRAGAENPLPITFTPAADPDVRPQLGVVAARTTVVGLRAAPYLRALGLRVGDEVLSVDGRTLDERGLDAFREGDELLTVRVLRDRRVVGLSAAVSAEQRTRLADDVALGRGERVVVTTRPGHAAATAGVLAGDEIVAADGVPIGNWAELVDAVQAAGQRPVRLGLRRLQDDETLARIEIVVAPSPPEQATLGVALGRVRMTSLYRVDSVTGAIRAGMVASVDMIKSLYVTLKKLVTGDVAARNLGGIIQISRVSYHYAQSGWAVFVYFLGLLSLNLAFINVLPIPVLDGGHLMFLLIERIKGSPVSVKVHTYSQVLGLVFVIALMVFVTYNDILKLL